MPGGHGSAALSMLTAAAWFVADSALEGDGFELPVPEREDRVSSLGLLLARDRGVGADVSVQPGFVIIMPSPLEASGAPLCCSPVDPEDDERDQVSTIRAMRFLDFFSRGTGSSNPSPSSGESRANLKTTSTFRCPPAFARFRGYRRGRKWRAPLAL